MKQNQNTQTPVDGQDSLVLNHRPPQKHMQLAQMTRGQRPAGQPDLKEEDDDDDKGAIWPLHGTHGAASAGEAGATAAGAGSATSSAAMTEGAAMAAEGAAGGSAAAAAPSVMGTLMAATAVASGVALGHAATHRSSGSTSSAQGNNGQNKPPIQIDPPANNGGNGGNAGNDSNAGNSNAGNGNNPGNGNANAGNGNTTGPVAPEASKPAETQPAKTVQQGSRLSFTEDIFTKAPDGQNVEYVVLQNISAKSKGAGTASGGLYLQPADGSAPVKLEEGQVLSRDDFARVFWEGEGNEGGSFRFVASDAQGKPLSDAVPQIVPINESRPGNEAGNDTGANDSKPPVPGDSGHNPNGNGGDTSTQKDPHTQDTQHVGYGKVLKLDPALFTQGGAEGKDVEFVHVEGVNFRDTAAGNAAGAGLYLHSEDGKTLTKVTDDFTIERANFDRLYWHAEQDGDQDGSFRFVASDKQGKPVAGATPQIIPVEESPAPELKAPETLAAQKVPHGQQLKIDPALFSHDPDGRTVTSVVVQHIDADDKGGLYLHPEDGDAPRKITPEFVITQANFDRIYWHGEAEGLQDGKFQFVASDLEGTPVDGSTPRIVPVYETSPKPSYPDANTETVKVDHDSIKTMVEALFSGKDSATKPPAIRIGKIEPAGAEDGAPSPLRVKTGEDDQGQPTYKPLKEGDIVKAEDFGKVDWNALGNKGGKFTFQAVDSHDQPIDGSQPQVVTIHETPAAPTYGAAQTVEVGHHQAEMLDASLFTGTDAENPAPAIKILSIDPASPVQDGGPALLLKTGVTDQGQPTFREVTTNDVIRAEDFDKLQWNAAANKGGSFKFEAVDSDGSAIPDTQAQTVHVHEQFAPPVYGPEDTVRAIFEKTLELGEKHLNTLVGNEPEHAPAYIRITEFQYPHPHGANAENGSQTPLYKLDESGERVTFGKEDGRNIISYEDFAKLKWDASMSDGGFFTFEALDDRKNPIADSNGKTVTHTVNIDEDAVAGHHQGATNVATDSTTWLTHNAYAQVEGPTRFFKFGDIRAWESGGLTRIVREAAPNTDGKATAYEIIRHEGLALERAEAEAKERGGKLLTIDDQAELDWLQQQVKDENFGIHKDPDPSRDDTDLSHYTYTSKIASGDGTAIPQGDGTKGFIIEYSDYKSPLQLHHADDPEKLDYVKSGQVLNSQEMQRLSWNSRLNNGGKFWLMELEPDATNPNQAGTTEKGKWIEWGFEERSRYGTTDQWTEFHNKVGMRSHNVTSHTLNEHEVFDSGDSQHGGAPASTASHSTRMLDVWHGTSSLLDDHHHSPALI